MYSKKFSERLNDLLLDKDLSDLSKKLNVALSSIYYWKSGKVEIALSNLITLANYFEISIEYLIGQSDNGARIIPPKECPFFGESLRKVMKEKGVTTYYLRKNYKYGSKHFENWDKGADPLLSTLIKLSSILDCSVDYLVGRKI